MIFTKTKFYDVFYLNRFKNVIEYLYNYLNYFTRRVGVIQFYIVSLIIKYINKTILYYYSPNMYAVICIF